MRFMKYLRVSKEKYGIEWEKGRDGEGTVVGK
jgi:hypothetical protein